MTATRLAAQTPATPPAQLPPTATAGTDIPASPKPASPEAPPPQNAAAPAAPANATACPPVTQPAKTGFHDDHCGPCDALWIQGGPVLYWLKEGPGPFLAGGGGQSLQGGYDFGAFNGVAIDGGMWINSRHTIGLTLGGMILEHRATGDALVSNANGDPVIGRPIFDVARFVPATVLVSAPGALAGGIAQEATARFAAAQAGAAANVAYCKNYSLDALFGFRYLDLEESLTVVQATQALGNGSLNIAGVPVGALAIEDQFRTRNQFYGGQLGLRGEARHGSGFIRGVATVSFGPNHEVIDIAGVTRELGGAGLAVPGGLLAAGTLGSPYNPQGNIGRQITNRFAVVPELTGQIGCQVSAHVRTWVGYNFLYINDVARPGGQIDLDVNPRLVPASQAFGTTSGPAAPRPTLIRNDFFLHGIQFGLEVQF